MTVTAPTREIGYAYSGGYTGAGNWWQFDPDEDTPELQWPMSVKVYHAMRTQDAQVGSVLEAVSRPVLRTPWRLDPAGARSEVVEFVADDLGLPIVGKNPAPLPRMKDRFSWLEHLELALLMLPFGHMYFEQVYRVAEDGSRAHLRKLGPRMPRTIAEIDVARDGGLISITQWGPAGQMAGGQGSQKPIPVDRLVAYVFKREGSNWLGRSILRQAYKNWLIKDRLLRVHAQTMERNGMGIPDYEAAETETDLTKGLNLATSLRAGEAAGVARPSGSKLRLMGVEGTLPDALPGIEYHDNQIARAVLAHFLNLGQQAGTGSYALGVTFADFFTLSLQTLAQSIADTATMHIVEDLVDVNWGEQEPAPRICFDEIGSRQAATAQAIKLLIDAGVIQADEVLEQSTRQQYGLPPKDPDSVRAPAGGGGFADMLTGGGSQPAADGSQEYGAGSAVYAAGGADPKVASGSVGELTDEELTEALIQALAEFTGEVRASAEFESLHPRGAHGRFRKVVDRIFNALAHWAAGDGSDDPLPESVFKREHVREAAKARGITLRRGASRDEIVNLLKDDVRKHVRVERDQKTEAGPKRAKFTLQGLADPAKVREVEVENKIRAAYLKILDDKPAALNEWVGFADLREAVDDVPRAELDSVLKKMLRATDYNDAGRVRMIPVANTKALKPRDWAAALPHGDHRLDAISFGDASPRPLPKSHRDLDVAVYRDKDGKSALFEENDRGERGLLVQRFDSLDELESWARDNGEPRLAEWAAKERGGKAPEKAAPAKVPAKKTAPPEGPGGGAPVPHKAVPVKSTPKAPEIGIYQHRHARGLYSVNVGDRRIAQSFTKAQAEQLKAAIEAADDPDAVIEAAHRAYKADAAARTAWEHEIYDLAEANGIQTGRGETFDSVVAKLQRKKVALPEKPKPTAASKIPAVGAATARKAPAVKKTAARQSAVDRAQVARIANAFHEDWRKTRLQPDGTFEPRVKKTKDRAWIDAHGTDDVDIANTTYDALPEDWKAENRAAAEVVEGIIRRHGGTVDLSDEATRLEVGEEIHREWLARNSWAAGGDLDVPFADLPVVEQAKDIDQVAVAMRALAPPAKKATPAKRTPGKAVPADPETKFRAEMKKLAPPFGGEPKRQWDDARLGVLGYPGDRTPEEVVRQLDADIAANEEALRQHEALGIEPHLQRRTMRALPDDIERQREMARLIRKTFGLTPAKAAPAKKSTPPPAALPDLTGEDLRDALDLRKVDELKAMLRERNKTLPAGQKLLLSGRKRELVDRLVALGRR